MNCSKRRSSVGESEVSESPPETPTSVSSCEEMPRAKHLEKSLTADNLNDPRGRSSQGIYRRLYLWFQARTRRTNKPGCDSVMAKKRLKLLLRHPSENRGPAQTKATGGGDSEESFKRYQTDSGVQSASSTAPHTPSSDRDLRINPNVLLPEKYRNPAVRASNGTKASDDPPKDPPNEEGEFPFDVVSTWPFSGLFDAEEEEESGVEEQAGSMGEPPWSPIADWVIPWNDLIFDEPLRLCPDGDIYRGRWHGEVRIHVYSTREDPWNMRQFWTEAKTLSLLRHENLLLFMGASAAPPRVALVTAAPRGPSLHSQIARHSSISWPTKINIAGQVAQAMGYLHAKGIVHRELNTENIFLESKVKVSILDFSAVHYDSTCRPGMGSMPRRKLHYLSPEMMRSLLVEPPFIRIASPFSTHSDVFAFGTVLYELLSERSPWECVDTHSVIFRVGKGIYHPVDHLSSPQRIKDLIHNCWNPDPESRPEFPRIVRLLRSSMSLHRHRSTSEPRKLHRMGLT
ncbi:unnamed protein product [Darwinula stevensoni]|uniref:Protein kinase domain-containing protein n=1 Tax=Darwinula stevensoni TaxID=69355 RepID=A0A7R8X0B8_9CRUS|nr:unnamed protein product [Darwinula stevensoni]CAG0881532.1 unnamed protein product [Darwinula stevensoni]